LEGRKGGGGMAVRNISESFHFKGCGPEFSSESLINQISNWTAFRYANLKTYHHFSEFDITQPNRTSSRILFLSRPHKVSEDESL
jgi:hypothetical protein